MSDESSTSAPPPTKRKPLVRRIYPSTWLAILLTAGVMVLVEYPGHRGSSFNYRHGWPMAWSERGGRYTEWDPRVSWSLQRPGETVTVVPNWNEEQRNPWLIFGGDQTFSAVALIVDVTFAVGAVVFVAWSFQTFRRRSARLLQYRLRSLLAAVALIAVAISPLAKWHRDWQAEQIIINGLKKEATRVGVRTEWRAPGWLPESVAKVPGFRRLFDHVSSIELDGERFSSQSLAALESLKDLESFSIEKGSLSDSGFDSLASLKTLESLFLIGPHVSDEQLIRIAGLPRLKSLRLDNTSLTDTGLAALRNLHDLETLVIGSNSLSGKGLAQLKELSKLEALRVRGNRLEDRALPAIEQLQSLKYLELEDTPLSNLHLSGLRKLDSLQLSGNFRLASIRLSDLPALMELRIKPGNVVAEDRAYPALQLKGLDNLEMVYVDCGRLSRSGLQDVLRLPRLATLELSNVKFRDGQVAQFVGCSSLTNLTVNNADSTEVQVADAQQLISLTCKDNDSLKAVRVERCPALSHIQLADDPEVISLQVADVPSLATLLVELHTYTPTLGTLRQDLRIDGLADSAELVTFALRYNEPIPARIVAELAGLSHLQFVTLNCRCLRDADLIPLGRAENIEALDLSGCNLSPDAPANPRMFPPLARLNLSYTPVSDEAVAALQKSAPGLTVDFESKTPVVQDLRQQVARVRSGLARAILCKTNPEKLADEDFECLRGLEYLETLDLSDTHLTDAGLKHLARLPKLRELILRRTLVSDAGVRMLKEMPALVHVDIDGTRITAEGRRALGKLARGRDAERK
jgi:Leucine-rich repeat (LRR) protein